MVLKYQLFERIAIFATFAHKHFMKGRNIILLSLATLLTAALADASAQSRQKVPSRPLPAKAASMPRMAKEASMPQMAGQGDNYLQYIIEGKDTIYIDELPASKVYARVPKQKGREWRKYYRLVHNFSKTYPYALVARKLVARADSTIAADNLKRGKREKYINEVQSELFNVFEKPLRSLTVSQGAMLMKLIDREVGKSSYNIIKDYKNGIAAGFWQGIAKIFGSDLKKPYDPEGEDKAVEELVEIWEAGDFQAFYSSLFWQDPPIIDIPKEYL